MSKGKTKNKRSGTLKRNINFSNGILEVKLSLQWKTFIYIQYVLTSQWPVVKSVARFEVYISAPYEFLHDITCPIKKETKSSYRQAVIERFWIRLTQLTSTDSHIAQQLSTFQNSSVWYMLPESVKSGIPVFISNGNVTHEIGKIALTSSDISCPKFISVWQPICQMDVFSWRKWFHTHKVSIILKHDQPLPRHLHLPNSSGRYQIIQCRQSTTALYNLLSKWASFILIDNNTYLKLLYQFNDKVPLWFCIVRVTSKLPCAVLNVGFVTGTPGYMMHKICEELKCELASLILSTPLKENVCCIVLQKPLEKILIRYERMPSDFTTVIFPDGTQPPLSLEYLPQSPLKGTLFTTLSRYLYHKRWIWSSTYYPNPKLEVTAISRILNTLTRMRLKEGFNFAHSASGIITMVLELCMNSNSSCIVQYVLFPPHNSWRAESEVTSGSEEDVDREMDLDSELQIVTEVWIEPQYGTVQSSSPRTLYMNSKPYYELADAIRQLDFQCINSLLTLEHLNLMCQDKHKYLNIESDLSVRRLSVYRTRRNSKDSGTSLNDNSPSGSHCGSHFTPPLSQRIEHIPFHFDPINILSLCQQTELLFSMFTECHEKNSLSNNLDYELPNKQLLDNIKEHFQLLHDHELQLTDRESLKFTQQVVSRHRNEYPSICPVKVFTSKDGLVPFVEDIYASQWLCYIKRISATHVILTFIPDTLKSLKNLVSLADVAGTVDGSVSTERASSRGSNYSDVQINTTSCLPLPMYVYDCPLVHLIDSYINNLESFGRIKDVYEDHRYKIAAVHGDCVRLKSEELMLSSSPEPRSEESDGSDQKHNSRQHCRALVLTHSKCFVMSLFSSLHLGSVVHSSDVQFAMDQCEETVYDVDISYYIQTVCGHLKHLDEKINIQSLNHPTPCSDIKPLHRLIKEKFFEIVNVAFNPIPSNRDFYYCRNLLLGKLDGKQTDSDDDISIPQSGTIEFKSDKEVSIGSEPQPLLLHLESTNSDILPTEINPLFLHLICTIRYNNHISNTNVKVLPTCLGELIQNIESSTEYLEKSKLQISLDILCLTLPVDVQNVISNYASKEFRTTSISEGHNSSVDCLDTSFNSDLNKDPEPLSYLPEIQRKAISTLKEEIKWLLKDEITTALLDIEPVTSNTLNFVTRHVTESVTRSSCLLDTIDLNFVYGAGQSHEKFIQEFCKITITDYKLCKESDLYYLTKNKQLNCLEPKDRFIHPNDFDSGDFLPHSYMDHYFEVKCNNSLLVDKEGDDTDMSVCEGLSEQSDITSTDEGTDGGYEEDISEDEEDFDWLIHLDNKRQSLPNFWLVMRVEQDAVSIYFHCRFLDLPTSYVGVYLEVQRVVRDAIRDLCKRVNQSLLLQSLHDTRTCDILLESDDNVKGWLTESNTPTIAGNTAFLRMKSMDETSEESDPYPPPLMEASLRFKPGYFSCAVVWETCFILHPRLKTGPGKSGLSRGIVALKTVLDKFSVSNRSNMFVYQDVNSNVFYLRLHENIPSRKSSSIKSSDFDHPTVSRSPSIASLPLGQHRNNVNQSDQNASSVSSSEIRPRVRSFGEKESKDGPNEDTLILKVHGITETGQDVRCQLVQVLQNRLDDAVLEFLSIMLARNMMCPLTPEDVRFLQKPFRPSEFVIRVAVQEFAINSLDSFNHYLRQNLLQFLNIPKYTDSRPHSHFKDYSEGEQSGSNASDQNVFIYNQSQNPSFGSRGIACIILIIKSSDDASQRCNENYQELFVNRSFEEIIRCSILEKDDNLPTTYLEFKLWTQGRVNSDNLIQKLCAATSHATWDIVMEYYLLQSPLCETDKNDKLKMVTNSNKFNNSTVIKPITTHTSKEIECTVILDQFPEEIGPGDQQWGSVLPQNNFSLTPTSKQSPFSKGKEDVTLCPYEQGDDGVLTEVCGSTLPKWLQFGDKLLVPAVKKYSVVLANQHLINVTVKELQHIITTLSHDSAKVFKCVPTNDIENETTEEIFVPCAPSYLSSKCVIIARNFDLWKACIMDSSDFPEHITPQFLKHVQKFTPGVCRGNKYVPRQKILWALIQSKEIILYTYNWSKDAVDKLTDYSNNLGLWLSVRASVLISLTAQKLGLFYNQPITRKSLLSSNNPYISNIGEVESMIKFPKERTRRNVPLRPYPLSVLDAYRDAYHFTNTNFNDAVVVFTAEIQELKFFDKKNKEELKKLYSMWQSRTSTSTYQQINILKQNSRIIHHCHTPLLFLSKWRLQSAATRDHTLNTPINRLPEISALDRHVQIEENENWHGKLCLNFISDYRHYLQTMGFMPLQLENIHKRSSKKESSEIAIHYVQKTMLGGILIFTVQLSEPFFITKIYAIECNRLQSSTSRTSINQFTINFLDESDRIKILMHLHSFMYDFHLRCIHNYVSNGSGAKVCDGYHLTYFIDDFMKYYNKSPNFARNLVHAETITIKDLTTEGKQLYDYLLSNLEQYNLEVFSMHRESNNEYVLVQITSAPQVSYKDSQDRQHTDDFDITLIVSNLCTPYDPGDNVLHLKYYLILTSRREIYPKAEVERKLGKFRTVSSTAHGASNSYHAEYETNVMTKSLELESESDENTEVLIQSLPVESSSILLENNKKARAKYKSPHQHVEIKQESVNYLGYYSSHEQLMQQLILEHARNTQVQIRRMVAQGMVHCRTHLLWNKLVSGQEANHLTYLEFIELKSLAKLENVCNLNPNLQSLLNQPLTWYQGLSKLLLAKYSDQNRIYISPDGNIQHFVILHPRYVGAFMLLSLDLHTSRGDLYAVYRVPYKFEDSDLSMADRKALLNGFINCVCFYLWSGMI